MLQAGYQRPTIVASPDAQGRPMTDWEIWLAAAQRGDAHAYRCFLEAANAHLRRRFSRRMPAGDVEDLVQEVLLAVHAKRATYDPSKPLLPWLNAVAHYKWVDWLRARGRAPSDLADTEIADDRPDNPAAAHAVDLLLNELPAGQAEAIRLVKIVGHSVEEASMATGQSTSLVKVNIHRGLRRLAALVSGK